MPISYAYSSSTIVTAHCKPCIILFSSQAKLNKLNYRNYMFEYIIERWIRMQDTVICKVLKEIRFLLPTFSKIVVIIIYLFLK